jgi:hypothetical protein
MLIHYNLQNIAMGHKKRAIIVAFTLTRNLHTFKNSYLFQNDKYKKHVIHWDHYKYFLHLRFHSKIHSYEKKKIGQKYI